MELRAIELSRKMAELTGSEPVSIIKPRAEESIDLLPVDKNAISPAENSVKSSAGEIVCKIPMMLCRGQKESNQTTSAKKYEDKVGREPCSRNRPRKS